MGLINVLKENAIKLSDYGTFLDTIHPPSDVSSWMPPPTFFVFCFRFLSHVTLSV